MTTTYVVNREYSKTGIQITITARDAVENKQIPVTMKGNLLANPWAPRQVSTGKVCNFTVAANYNVNEDATLMGTIIESISEVCAFYGMAAPKFNGYIPMTMGAWDAEADIAYSTLHRGDFIKMQGDVKIRVYTDKTGTKRLDVHMGNFASYVVLKAKTVADDIVIPFNQAV